MGAEVHDRRMRAQVGEVGDGLERAFEVDIAVPGHQGAGPRVEAGGFVGREQAFEQAVAALFDLAAGVVDCHRGG